VALALIAAGVGAAVLLTPLPPSPPGPEPGRSLFHAHCATCHGLDGRGSTWRARLLLLRPGDLTSPEAAGAPDGYLADIIRQGGASIGKPGMPSFGFSLSDAEIRALIAYIRTLPAATAPPRVAAPGRRLASLREVRASGRRGAGAPPPGARGPQGAVRLRAPCRSSHTV
jgi:mono/diheme cytochrome c family protein